MRDTKILFTIYGALLLALLFIFKCSADMDSAEPDTYNYNPARPLVVSNPDSTMMMLWCRGERDSLFRLRNGL